MSLRITQEILYDNSLLYLQKGLRRLNNAQVPVLTGKRINKPSDDPVNTIRVMQYKEEHQGLKNYQKNIDTINGFQESAAGALQSLSEQLTEARELTVQGANGGLTQADRDTIAMQIDKILGETIALANSHFGGRYLFGGSHTSSPPYTLDGQNNIAYNGDNKTMRAWISPGNKAAFNIPGPEIFQVKTRGDTIFNGNTGAATGSGMDSGVGDATLVVSHGTTTYTAGIGVTAGASSAAGDTIIGATGTHTLTLNVTSPTTGTVSLDGGPAIAYDTTAPNAADFQVTDDDGDLVYVDLTGALSSGTVDITSTGTLSLDGGVTTTAINFSSNQVVYNSLDESVTNVDTTGIVRTGNEYLTYTGTLDLFEVLTAIRDDLRNTRGLPEEEQVANISARIMQLIDAHEDVITGMAEFGGRTMRLDLVKNRLEEFDLRLTELTAGLEEADITEALMELELANQAMQIAQSVANKVLQATMLVNFR
ncbi:MAG: flagellar hook-associated protein FlgL [Planctomycetota bacterium]|jgi:flagellar hook-associated protein 3